MAVGIGTAFAQAVAPAPPAAATAPRTERLLPLEVFINSTKGGVWTLLERGGLLYAPEDAFEEWRLIRSPSAQNVQFQGQTWYPLSGIPGFEARLNFATQSVDLVFAPAAFNAVRLTREAALRPPLSPSIPAAFLNYDLSYTASRDKGSNPDVRDLGALTELGFSGDWGLLTSSYVGRNLESADAQVSASWRRLETTYTRNFLDTNTTLRLGDSITRPGLTARAVYFGGLQVAKNFALQPGFISYPIPVVTGVSAAPSTVELYINDALRQTSNVPPGPFSIDNFPALTGAGEARIVVRDILGRETVVTQPLFSSASLLEQGLTDWSFELGSVRQGLGTDNASYGPGFVSGLWRQGLNKSLTAELNGEWSSRLQRLSVGASYELPFQMLGQTAVGASRSDTAGSGLSWAAAVERAGLRHGLSFSASGASRGWRQLGIDSTQPLPRLQTTASYSYSSNDFGAFSLSFGSFSTYDRGTLRTVGLNYTVRLAQRSALTFNATQLSGASSGSSVGISLLVPLDSRVVVAAGANVRGGTTEYYLNASRTLAAETGWGWRTAAGSRGEGRFAEGGAYYQGTKGLFSADVSDAATQQTVRLGLLGGAVFADGHLFASRRVQDSFAIVEVPGHADVGVGFQSSTLTRTGADGVALLPRLLPFQRNSVRLDPSELPISAELDSIEQEAVPALRGAVKITFPVRSGRGALIRIVLDDGAPAPAGAQLELVGDRKEFFVARRGEAFVTGLQPTNQLRLRWNGNSCTFTVTLPPGELEDIARVGPTLCTGVPR
ncbi:fimbria/pilus outer membrane usher protein [Ramlibacter tataouinensis]|uniref:fimbria/pilus outer membrane usher protein n=1 Tax=Ramlibacter tataouinensis TaxID=94132 RepID=UPI001D05C1EE|nr:fimbria/pilus outer membrane usher protein [Ramlibacter tataouinensis]